MLVYYDVIADKEVASDSYPSTSPAKGVLAIQSKKITVSDDVGIASNADDEEGAAAEALEDGAQQVIDVVYSARLSQVTLDKKEYKTLQKAYWKKLIDTLNDHKWAKLGFGSDNPPPSGKEAAAAAETQAYADLSAYEKKLVDEIKAKVTSYKANFEGLQKFCADEVIANFDEFEFYTPEEAELGSCMIIPARYVGEAVAPVFYFYADGLREEKA